MKILCSVLGMILTITALPLQILLNYYFFGKIASISVGYCISIFYVEFITSLSQALLGFFLITIKIREKKE